MLLRKEDLEKFLKEKEEKKEMEEIFVNPDTVLKLHEKTTFDQKKLGDLVEFD